MKKIIYDLGSGDGSNLPYYLLKGDQVIAVEANKNLCEIIKKKFKKEIKKKKLILVNVIITNKKDKLNDIFFIHKYNNLLGQHPTPVRQKKNYYPVTMPSKNVISLINTYGDPYYIKIDLENYDNVILKKILSNNIRHTFLSVEANNDETLNILSKIGKYHAYKIINGKKINNSSINNTITSKKKKRIKYFFPINSAGPFGEDINGNWMTFSNLQKMMKYAKVGWNDIHCSKINIAQSNYFKLPEMKLKNKIIFYIKNFLKIKI